MIKHHTSISFISKSEVDSIKMSLDVNLGEPDEFNCAELHCVIEDLTKSLNINSVSYNVDFLCGKGVNFVSNLFRLTIKDTDDKESNFILKTLINTERQELFHELHSREVYVYKVVMPEYQKMLLKFNEVKRLHLVKCYFTCNDIGNEVIILEDLNDKDFKMDQDKFKSVDYEHGALIFRKLAKFHALSIILEKEEPDVFNEIKNNCQDIIFDDNFLNKSKLKDYFTVLFNTSVNLVIDEAVRRVLLNKVEPNLIALIKKYLKPRRRNVLCHGDFWINNILFKNEEEKPVDSILVDFQALRYACPVTDIMYFTYLCTDAAFRDAHFQNLLDLYYQTLKEVLDTCNIEIEEEYPRSEFDNDVLECEDFGLLCALVELKMTTVRTEDETLLTGCGVGTPTEVIDSGLRLYSLRVNELINEFSKKGNLNKLLI